MKDLIAKLQMDANCALGAIWMHIEAREKRIAELEAQQAFGIGETYANALSRIAELESEVTRLSASWRGDATVADALEERIAELEAQIAAAPVPVVEEKDLWALLPNSAWYLDPPDGGNVSLLEQLQRMSKDAAAYRSTALQAPVREVPGWQPIETAPKDGTCILVCRAWDADGKPMGNSHRLFTHRAAWWADENGGNGEWVVYNSMVKDPECFFTPTHWMPVPDIKVSPLPAAPVQQEGE